ncbi:very long chain fatty acid elongase AAEL008004-like [Dermacentor variabilis]|uniref:very long chain fatty acid elongase AAEL008004-like n=1 Tax=Dermacentor variabilis TaxID=34621 RepID=UPI003F5C968B
MLRGTLDTFSQRQQCPTTYDNSKDTGMWQQQGINATGAVSRYSALSWFQPDERVRDWPLMGGPAAVTSVLALYLMGCVVVGPRLMRDCKAFSMRPTMFAYNVAMVGLSVFFAYLTVTLAYFKSGYNLVCQANDSKTNPLGDIISYYGWWYVMLKVGELLDTVFFVLRKKNDHISFLHVLHHTLALITVWLDVNLGIMGQVALFPLLNSSVHVVMYSYYALSALPPSIRPNLWWKRYVTVFQIAQFFVLMVHSLVPVFKDCDFPRAFAVFMALEAGLFFYLFSDFYVKNYGTEKERASSAKLKGH